MNCISIKNNQAIPYSSIPELGYPLFMELNVFTLMKGAGCHCVNYFGVPQAGKIKLICCIANDDLNDINISSCVVALNEPLPSFTKQKLLFEKFEREIHENFGLAYTDHPWLKPVRFSFNRFNKKTTVGDYPFFKIDSEELHEVGVGPIHAGIIESGHFRFICNGEQILHLEIQLGYQHRGIEQLFIEKKKLLQRITLAENISGDSVAGHTVAFVNLWESLCNYEPDKNLQWCRTLALELERVAIYTGGLSGMCQDVAYQLGSAVFGRLRTPVINFFQKWCGNRLAKSLIRAGKNNFPFTPVLAAELTTMLNDFEKDFEEICNELFSLPSALARFEKTGVVTAKQASTLGAVGLYARASGITRDIRFSHPYSLYQAFNHQPIIKHHGDVYSRAQIRKEEIRQSIGYIRQLLQNIPEENNNPAQWVHTILALVGEDTNQGRQAAVAGVPTGHSLKQEQQFGMHPAQLYLPAPNTFILSLVEGWRGEICHCAITDDSGELAFYKIKDPSFHNWLPLALAVRNNEISDFPICNKSFDLSYAGHDL